ncbi:MAG: hypothetical protein LBS82_00605 [Spirochaetaceae bacterium]|jgi:hypothetical protein|nr:hypothetical protein [Spirochaetaceae bacterium]
MLPPKCFFLALVVVLAGCATRRVPLITQPVAAGVVQFFIPPTAWSVSPGGVDAVKIDATYRTLKGNAAFCNISFFGEKSIPAMPSSLKLIADGKDYPLGGVSIVYVDAANKELRITANLAGEEFIQAASAGSIALGFVCGDATYKAEASKAFYSLADRFSQEVVYYGK